MRYVRQPTYDGAVCLVRPTFGLPGHNGSRAFYLSATVLLVQAHAQLLAAYDLRPPRSFGRQAAFRSVFFTQPEAGDVALYRPFLALGRPAVPPVPAEPRPRSCRPRCHRFRRG